MYLVVSQLVHCDTEDRGLNDFQKYTEHVRKKCSTICTKERFEFYDDKTNKELLKKCCLTWKYMYTYNKHAFFPHSQK